MKIDHLTQTFVEYCLKQNELTPEQYVKVQNAKDKKEVEKLLDKWLNKKK